MVTHGKKVDAREEACYCITRIGLQTQQHRAGFATLWVARGCWLLEREGIVPAPQGCRRRSRCSYQRLLPLNFAL
jgi:hypothetical protein